MKTNLKDNIWIEGFDITDLSEYFVAGVNYTQSKDKQVLYVGKTSEIPKEIAKKYFDYGYDNLELHYTSINQAIKETCNQEYCIIYKI